MRSAGLPRPSTQVVFRSDQRTVARVDFLYRELAIVVEVTGRRGHSSPSERARDAQRRNELQDIGVRVIEYTWEDVMRRAAYVTGSMRERLTAA
jgi:very-short-patch-repair endonuclease